MYFLFFPTTSQILSNIMKRDTTETPNEKCSGKLKNCHAYFFEDADFGGNLWNSYPYRVLKNSKFETEASKLRGAHIVRFDSKGPVSSYNLFSHSV